MVIRILTIFLACLISTGCASYSQLSGIKQEGQEIRYRDGKESIISSKTNTVAVTVADSRIESGKRAFFIVAVKNGAKQELVFSTENISAKVEDDIKTENVNLKVYSYEELVAEEKSRQNAEAFAAALNGFSRSLNAANAGYSTTYGNYSGNTGYGYGNRYSGTYSSTTYNYAAAQAAQDRAQAMTSADFDRIKSEGEQNLRALAQNIMKKQTVLPGEWHGGVIQVGVPPIREFQTTIVLNVDLGSEEHLFRFKKVKVDD